MMSHMSRLLLLITYRAADLGEPIAAGPCRDPGGSGHPSGGGGPAAVVEGPGFDGEHSAPPVRSLPPPGLEALCVEIAAAES